MTPAMTRHSSPHIAEGRASLCAFPGVDAPVLISRARAMRSCLLPPYYVAESARSCRRGCHGMVSPSARNHRDREMVSRALQHHQRIGKRGGGRKRKRRSKPNMAGPLPQQRCEGFRVVYSCISRLPHEGRPSGTSFRWWPSGVPLGSWHLKPTQRSIAAMRERAGESNVGW